MDRSTPFVLSHKWLALTVVGVAFTLTMGCGDSDSDTTTPETGTATQATAEQPAEFVAALGDFTDYRYWRTLDYSTGYTNPYLVDKHMAADNAYSRRVWINEPGARSREAGEDSYPLGTVIVKETFTWDESGNKQFAAMGGVLGMVKRGGNFNKDGEHWEWFMLASDPATSALEEIKDRGGASLMDGMCNSCHASANAQTEGSDMVFAHPSDIEVTDGFFADYATWSVIQNTPENHVLLSMAHKSADPDTIRTVYKKQLQANPKHTPDTYNVIADVYPIGTAILKTVADATGAIIEITAMVKRAPAFNEDHGGWEWFMLDPATAGVMPEMRGAGLGNNMCNTCHIAATGPSGLNGVDYVFKHPNDPFVNMGEPVVPEVAPEPAAAEETVAVAEPVAAEEPAAATSNLGPAAFKADFATSPEFYTNMIALNSSNPPSPHNAVKIWYSINMQEMAAAGSTGPWPEGTTSIKQVDMAPADGVIDEIVVMIKMAAGYDTANGDWYYEARDANGTLLTDEAKAPGKNAMCIGCHAANSKDYLAGLDLR